MELSRAVSRTEGRQREGGNVVIGRGTWLGPTTGTGVVEVSGLARVLAEDVGNEVMDVFAPVWKAGQPRFVVRSADGGMSINGVY